MNYWANGAGQAKWPVTEARPPEAGTPLKLLCVNDKTMVLEGLMAAIDGIEDSEIVCAAAKPPEALGLANEDHPDVIVLGADPLEVGLKIARQLRDDAPAAAVVLLAADHDDSLLLEAVESGCVAVVSEAQSVSELLFAVKAAAKGHSMLPFKVLGQFRSRALERSGYGLTSRELEILELLGAGETTRTISERLILSPHTVRNHVRNLLAKLCVHSKLEAVVRGHGLGLIQLPADG